MLILYGTYSPHDERMKSVASAERAYWSDDRRVHHQEEAPERYRYSMTFLAVDLSIIGTVSRPDLAPRPIYSFSTRCTEVLKMLFGSKNVYAITHVVPRRLEYDCHLEIDAILSQNGLVPGQVDIPASGARRTTKTNT